MINNQYASDKTTIANEFCRYFSNLGKIYASAIPPTDISAPTYFSKRAPRTLFFNPVNISEILNIINNLKSKKKKFKTQAYRRYK